MKIVFICGALEPGRDGVGDYTRRLAGELKRMRHQVSIVALHDWHIIKPFVGVQTSEGTDFPVLRLPISLELKTRFIRAKEWIDDFKPDWLSLQFVPFSFHTKGLPFYLSKYLEKLSDGRYWHIMFHELWVGMNVDSDWKIMWWGWLQRQIIKYTIIILKPTMIHTHCRLYQRQLIKLGFDAHYLPLFGNIPVTVHPRSAKALFEAEKRVIFAVFGTIHKGAPVDQFVKEVSVFSQKTGTSAKLKIVGRCGAEQQRWTLAWNSAGLEVEQLGEQPACRVSEMLSSATVGITTNPCALVEKSGTVAAMREHGLNILCVAQPWKPKSKEKIKPPIGVFDYSAVDFNLDQWLTTEQPIPNVNSLSKISEKMVNDCLA